MASDRAALDSRLLHFGKSSPLTERISTMLSSAQRVATAMPAESSMLCAVPMKSAKSAASKPTRSGPTVARKDRLRDAAGERRHGQTQDVDGVHLE